MPSARYGLRLYLASNVTAEDKEDVSCIATEILTAFDDGRWKWHEDIVISDGEIQDTEKKLLFYRRQERQHRPPAPSKS